MKNKPPTTRREFMKFGAIIGAFALLPSVMLELEIPKEEAEQHLIPMLSDGKWHKVEYGKYSGVERIAIDGVEIPGVRRAHEFPVFFKNTARMISLPKQVIDNYTISCNIMIQQPPDETYLDDMVVEGWIDL